MQGARSFCTMSMPTRSGSVLYIYIYHDSSMKILILHWKMIILLLKKMFICVTWQVEDDYYTWGIHRSEKGFRKMAASVIKFNSIKNKNTPPCTTWFPGTALGDCLCFRDFYWKCRENVELPLKNDDFLLNKLRFSVGEGPRGARHPAHPQLRHSTWVYVRVYIKMMIFLLNVTISCSLNVDKTQPSYLIASAY